jgi:hypothetical protein
MWCEEDGVYGITQDVIDNYLAVMCQSDLKNMHSDV